MPMRFVIPAAVATLERAVERATTDYYQAVFSLRLAFALMQAGDETTARRVVREARELVPLSQKDVRLMHRFQHSEHLALLQSQLARVGLPD